MIGGGFFSAELPHIRGLFYAVGLESFFGTTISATGLGDSTAQAERLRDAEMAERRSQILAQANADRIIARDIHSGARRPFSIGKGNDGGRPRCWTEGIAAAAQAETALLNAALEALERDASMRWWYGGRDAVVPGAADNQVFQRLQQDWRRREPRRTKLLDITPEHGIPVFVAWSCAGSGRDLCFGTACRLQRAAAIRAALKELHQMEFGLDVARYRQRHDVVPSRRERIMLARAGRLCLNQCGDLLHAAKATIPDAPELDTADHLGCHLDGHGIALFAVELPRSDDRHRVVRVYLPASPETATQDSRPRHWARWDLY